MTPRERYLETMLFGRPDRVPFSPGGPREKTLARWRSEGLPAGADWFTHLCAAFGVERETGEGDVQPGVSSRMNPVFEEQVLEHRGGHYVVRDWMGNVTEISDEYDHTYIREAKDFVTRKWHRFPVEDRADFAEMRTRYDPDDPSRYPADFDERVRDMKGRRHAKRLAVSGPFWQMREWCGFEPLCMLFAEDPGFVEEMAAFWTDFVSRLLARALDAGVIDCLLVSEDMAYKGKSMVSPAMARRFLFPAWARWAREARQAGVSIVEIDSDGCVDELIPLWVEAGVNATIPVEAAAGCDIVAYRACFGRAMAYRGGVDKRCIAKGGKPIEDELARIAPVVKAGGYIPSCDHAVPPDVSWPDFVRYARLLAGLTGWL